MNSDLKRLIINNHATKKNNFCINKPDESYHLLNINTSFSCSDKWKIYVKINKDIIDDIKYSGEGCTISTSSISILSSLLTNKNINEVFKILEEYINFIKTGKSNNLKILGDLIVFENIHNIWNRIECALIGTKAIYKFLKEKYE